MTVTVTAIEVDPAPATSGPSEPTPDATEIVVIRVGEPPRDVRRVAVRAALGLAAILTLAWIGSSMRGGEPVDALGTSLDRDTAASTTTTARPTTTVSPTTSTPATTAPSAPESVAVEPAAVAPADAATTTVPPATTRRRRGQANVAPEPFHWPA